MNSALPWSAVNRIVYPFSRANGIISLRHLSTVPSAFFTAGNDPECPTRSGLAKFNAIKSYLRRDFSSFTSASLTAGALISGLSAYDGTFGDGIIMRFSPLNGFLIWELKKNVTCAYFSVSAIRSCFLPCVDRISERFFFTVGAGKSTGAFFEYGPKQTKYGGFLLSTKSSVNCAERSVL